MKRFVDEETDGILEENECNVTVESRIARSKSFPKAAEEQE
jgi:hypothetical protein